MKFVWCFLAKNLTITMTPTSFCNLFSLEVGRMSFAGVSNRQKASRQVSGGSAKPRKLKARRKPVWDVRKVAFTLT